MASMTGYFGDLILHLAGRAVIQIKMSPAVSFRHPDNLLAVIHIITIFAAGLSPIALQGWESHRSVSSFSRSRERSGKLLMIERRSFGQRICINQHEFIPTLDRFPIPEAAGIIDPVGSFGDVDS